VVQAGRWPDLPSRTRSVRANSAFAGAFEPLIDHPAELFGALSLVRAIGAQRRCAVRDEQAVVDPFRPCFRGRTMSRYSQL
jgi:hypothetical protein